MANKAVFLDRDGTLIDDPGYLSDPSAVKLLPGVDLAIKSLASAGYKIVVVTNQSGIARGMLTEETLEEIHAELRRQLSENGAHLDAIYYCPFHPEGKVEKYTMESELRKPQPGMLLKAAADLEIDLAQSWSVGDGARDVEAGQRAGCRTIRLRPHDGQSFSHEESEDAQADFTVRNLVEAARIILREKGRPVLHKPVTYVETQPNPLIPQKEAESTLDDSVVRQEILRYVRQMVMERQSEEFSLTKLLGGIVQMLALLGLLLAFWKMMQNQTQMAMLWGQITIALQLMALTFFMMKSNRG